jgi:hypothetical protein
MKITMKKIILVMGILVGIAAMLVAYGWIKI